MLATVINVNPVVGTMICLVGAVVLAAVPVDRPGVADVGKARQRK